jgi:hypothetical protein
LEIIKDGFFTKYIDNLDMHKPEVTIAMGPLLNLRDGGDISQYKDLLEEEKKLKEKKSKEKMAKEGLLKDIWYNDEIHFVALGAVKEINGTDVVKLPTEETVTWNKDEEKWVEYQAH